MNTKNLIGGILAGIAVGVSVGLLMAPESGSKTRDRLVKGARKIADELKNAANGLKDTAKDSMETSA